MLKFKVTLFNISLFICFVDFVSSQLTLQLPNNLSEDGRLNFTQLAAKYGHPAEKYHITTEDGYILTLFRLLGNISQPVLLQHGLFESSDDFILRGNTSLSIILADKGYDVWLGNSRGNRYSRRHVTLNPDTDSEFFNYSFEEFGYYDTPAVIDFILKETGQKKLSVIGHSEGATMYLVLGSRKPEYNDKIKILIALAPPTVFYNAVPPISFALDIFPIVKAVANLLGQVEVFQEKSLLRQLIESVCSKPVIGYEICLNLIGFPLIGYDPEQLEPEFLPTYIGHFPTSSSLKNFNHYSQIRFRGKFARYDYGAVKNLVLYNSVTPPKYDLNKVTMKIMLMSAKNDRLVAKGDTEMISPFLPNVEYYVVEQPLFNHMDFVIGRETYKFLYPQLVDVLEKYN